jgi:hypothetical protein
LIELQKENRSDFKMVGFIKTVELQVLTVRVWALAQRMFGLVFVKNSFRATQADPCKIRAERQ